MNLVRHKIGGGETWKAPLGVKRVKAIIQARTGNHVFAGAGHAGALQFSAILCWGYNANGQLGDNSVITKSQPVGVTGMGSSSFTVVASGTSDFSLALRLDGTLYSWGNGANGRLASGATTPRSSPVAISGSVSFLFVSGYSAGGNAISSEGKLYGWGQNSKGEVGDNSTTQRTTATLANSSTDWFKTAGGLNHVVGLRTNGNMYTWGLNDSGQLGDNGIVAKSTPTLVVSDKIFIDCAAANNTSWALDRDGNLYGWGSNAYGQIGDGTIVDKSTPTLVLGGLKFKKVRAGDNCVAALDRDGNLYAWGSGATGALGNGALTDQSTPVAVSGGHIFTDFAVGNYFDNFMVGVKSNGLLYSWGGNTNGQLGDNSVVPKSTPVAVTGSSIYRMLDRFVLKEVYIDVEPNRDYQLTLGNAIIFGSEVIYYSTTERYNYEITLEYGT